MATAAVRCSSGVAEGHGGGGEWECARVHRRAVMLALNGLGAER